MNPQAELLLLYGSNPAALGLTSRDEVQDIIRKLAGAVDSDDENILYHSVHYRLLRLELGVLRQNPEKFAASGQMSVEQGLAARLRDIRRDMDESAGIIGISAGGGWQVLGGTVSTVPSITEWPDDWEG